MLDTDPEAGPSRPRIEDGPAPREEDEDEDEDGGFGLTDLLPEPTSPIPPPFSFSIYTPPPGLDLDLEDRDGDRQTERDKETDITLDLGLPDGREYVVLRLVGSHPLWGHHLWNTARSLTTFLLRHSTSFITDKRIIELGAGAGLPSIVAALAGARRVIATDYPDEELVANLAWNVGVNVGGETRERVGVEGHVWGKSVQPILDLMDSDGDRGNGCDLLLLSDLVFNHSQHQALISSVNSLLSPIPPPSSNPTPHANPYPTPCILVFFTHHRPHLAAADMAFFPALAESGDGAGWAYEKVVEEWTGPMFDEDPGDERVRGTVHGWRAWRVAPGEERGERMSRV